MALASAPYRRAVITLIISRLALAALLTGGAMLTGYLRHSIDAARPLVTVGALIFGMTVAYLLAYPRFGAASLFVFIQLCMDGLAITGLLLYTGGANSIFVVLYFLILLAGALMLERGWSLRLLAVVIAEYGLLIVLIGTNWPPLKQLPGVFFDPLPLAELYYLLFLHLLGFILISSIGVRLSSRVQFANLALAAAERTFADYRAFADALVSGITDAVLAVGRSGVVVFANEEAQRRFPDSLGQPLAAVLPDLDTADLFRRVNQYGSTTVDLPPGTARPAYYEIHVFGLSGGGQPGTALILRDVTNFKKLQTELKFKENMAALGQLSARIAHEIRNPLAAISGAAQMLHGQSRDPAPQKLMGVIVSEAERLSAVLDDFLKYTRPEAVNPENGDLLRLVRDTLTLAGQQPGPAIRFKPPVGPCSGPFDADRIRQVLWNLISNARKAAPEAAELFIDLELDGAGRIELAVEDCGPGVPAEKQAAIFIPFERGFGEGSGLGLAIAHKIAEGHGGRLELRVPRHTPQGARFVLVLPGFTKVADAN